VFGTGAAVLAGDALVPLATTVLTDVGRLDMVPALTDAVTKLVWGQAEDSRFEQRADVSVPEYIAMVEGKTGAVLEFACTIGAELAHAPVAFVDQLRRVGAHLGIAFQAADDILGIWGDPAVTGKPVYSDLARRKKTLPILAALGSSGDAGAELGAVLAGNHALGAAALARAAELVEAAGGRARAGQEVSWRHERARAELTGLRLPDHIDRSWRSIIDKLTDRRH
jgi:geranylgeranyl diphosphate synthase type I